MQDKVTGDTTDNITDNITRRQFFTGILGTSALLSGTLVMLAGCEKKDSTAELIEAAATYAPNAEICYLDVMESQIVASVDAEEFAATDYLRERSSFDLPIGCLLYQDSDDFAVVLQSRAGAVGVIGAGGAGTGLASGNGSNGGGNGSGSNTGGGSDSSVGGAGGGASNGSSNAGSLITLALLDLTDGKLNNLLVSSVGADEDYIVYDARANDSIIVWVECQLSSGSWRVYAAALEGGAGGTRGAETLLDEGDALYDPPMLCVCNQSAYWTVMPDPEGAASSEDSLLKRTQLEGSGSSATVGLPEQVYVSYGRMLTNPQASGGIVTFVPRVDVSTIFYQLTALDDATGEITNVAVLPPSLRVSDAVFGTDGFSFQIEANYDYAKGLSLYGTYKQLPDERYFFANKTPSSPTVDIAQCLYVKSTKNIIGFSVTENRFFIVDTPKDCVDYGDVLAGSGTQQTLVTYTTIINKLNADKSITRVRVFEPVV